MKIIYRRYHDWKFYIAEWKKGDKQFYCPSLGKVRISSCYCFESTKANIELAKKHNELIDQITTLEGERQSILQQMTNEV